MKRQKLNRILSGLEHPQRLFAEWAYESILGAAGRVGSKVGMSAIADGFIRRFYAYRRDGQEWLSDITAADRTKYLVEVVTTLEQKGIVEYRGGLYLLLK